MGSSPFTSTDAPRPRPRFGGLVLARTATSGAPGRSTLGGVEATGPPVGTRQVLGPARPRRSATAIHHLRRQHHEHHERDDPDPHPHGVSLPQARRLGRHCIECPLAERRGPPRMSPNGRIWVGAVIPRPRGTWSSAAARRRSCPCRSHGTPGGPEADDRAEGESGSDGVTTVAVRPPGTWIARPTTTRNGQGICVPRVYQ